MHGAGNRSPSRWQATAVYGPRERAQVLTALAHLVARSGRHIGVVALDGPPEPVGGDVAPARQLIEVMGHDAVGVEVHGAEQEGEQRMVDPTRGDVGQRVLPDVPGPSELAADLPAGGPVEDAPGSAPVLGDVHREGGGVQALVAHPLTGRIDEHPGAEADGRRDEAGRPAVVHEADPAPRPRATEMPEPSSPGVPRGMARRRPAPPPRPSDGCRRSRRWPGSPPFGTSMRCGRPWLRSIGPPRRRAGGGPGGPGPRRRPPAGRARGGRCGRGARGRGPGRRRR